MFKSIRWRLLAWHAGILSLAVVGYGLTLYGQIHKARHGEVDAELLASARTLEGTLRGFPMHILEGKKEPPVGVGVGGGGRGGPGGPGGGGGFGGGGGKGGGPGGRPPRGEGPPPNDGGPSHGPLPPPDRNAERLLTLPSSAAYHAPDAPVEPHFFVVWASNGTILKTENLPADFVTPAFDSVLGEETERPEVRQLGPIREVGILGPRRSRILVGRTMYRELHDLTWLAWQLLVIGAGVLTVGLLGGFFLVGGVVRPISAMSATAASISASNLDHRIDVTEIDSELGKLASVLNEMFTRLEGAFDRQARFTADASHELRTPLAIIHSHAELALSRPREPAEYQETLKTCVRASRRMKAIVEGLLTLARADVGKLELTRQPLDLGILTTDVVALLEPLARQKGVSVQVDLPKLEIVGEGEGDAIRLAQVVTNLVTNAINYNRPGGSVCVKVTSAKDHAILAVSDTGCGIPEEDSPHIFERFYRVDKARAREQGGSGLGLAISKSIVEGLGGSIGFTSVVNQGTTFTVRLPLSQYRHVSLEQTGQTR